MFIGCCGKISTLLEYFVIYCVSTELEQDEQLERMRKEQELRKKKEKEDSLTLEQTKEQVLWLIIVYLKAFQVMTLEIWLLKRIVIQRYLKYGI